MIGAAGFLGGVTQMAVALTVVLLEITNDLVFLLPIMVSIGVAPVIMMRTGIMMCTHIRGGFNDVHLYTDL